MHRTNFDNQRVKEQRTGAWGTGTIENDDACDWVYELEDKGVAAITDAFDAIKNSVSYKDALKCCNALAASEVVAAIYGNPAGTLTEEVETWIRDHRDASVPVERTLGATRQTRESSELRELWVETDDFNAWLASVDDLIARLESAARS